MNKYIKYDTALRYIKDAGMRLGGVWGIEATAHFEHEPSIDIVRCQDCKFSDEVITSCPTDGKNIVVERLCQLHKWSVKDDDFCSYAEPKER